MAFKILKNKKLYWWLIGTFALLYLAVAAVSTIHAVAFFQLSNSLALAILLGAAYEVGQAAVLFSILMTKNKGRMLAWGMMFLLTALQVTANVYASFKFMDSSGSTDWTYWQRAILFGVQAENVEMYKVIISWISGALLPIVALGMTALVADNIHMMEGEEKKGSVEDDRVDEIIENEVQKRVAQKLIEPSYKLPSPKDLKEGFEVYDKANVLNPLTTTSTLELTPQAEIPTRENVEPAPLPRIDMEKVAEAVKSGQEIFKKEDKKEEQFEKDFIIPKKEESKKKRGRPPKEMADESKKEKESSPKEEVKIPKKRTIHPLKRKSKKIIPLKNLNEINKLSIGDKIIKIIENIDKEKDKVSIIKDTSVNLDKSETTQETPDPYNSYILDGVEVVDVKAIEKLESEKKNL